MLTNADIIELNELILSIIHEYIKTDEMVIS